MVRNVIYLLPIGDLDGAPDPELLLTWCRAFFHGLRVELLNAVSTQSLPTDVKASKSGALGARKLNDLLSRRLPSDGFCVLGVTMSPLVPEVGKSEILGLAKLNQRVGVFSLDWESLLGRESPDDDDAAAVRAAQLLRRSLIVMTHEITHMFGIRHCEYFHCRMMDAYAMDDVLADTDALPADVCPVELRKLHAAISPGGAALDAKAWMLERYQSLLAACEAMREAAAPAAAAVFDADAAWLRARVGSIVGAPKEAMVVATGGGDAATGEGEFACVPCTE